MLESLAVLKREGLSISRQQAIGFIPLPLLSPEDILCVNVMRPWQLRIIIGTNLSCQT